MTRLLHRTIAVLSAILVILILVAIFAVPKKTPDTPPALNNPTDSTGSAGNSVSSQATTPSTQAPITKLATATIGSTGDIILHDNVILSGYDKKTDTYDFSYIFKHMKDYVKSLDYAVGNFECTMAGKDNGYPYKGFPTFNAPEAIAVALRDIGMDMLLTANNHSYDTRTVGLLNTQKVIQDLGMDHLGTQLEPEAKTYTVKEINGIKVGMTCYTYDTSDATPGKMSLNGISMSDADAQLINTFNYKDLDSFYATLETEIAAMRAEGAEALMIYIHWGSEVTINASKAPNNTQKQMGQKLCDLGFDVIVGGHPHIIQPIELFQSTVNPEHSTVCLYSMGNSVSNIRHSLKWDYDVEDGLFFNVTFAKYSDGSVIVEGADIYPYYVERYEYTSEKPYMFPIYPLNLPQDQWREAYDLTDAAFTACKNSLKRTEEKLLSGLETVNNHFSQKQAQLEASLGIS